MTDLTRLFLERAVEVFGLWPGKAIEFSELLVSYPVGIVNTPERHAHDGARLVKFQREAENP